MREVTTTTKVFSFDELSDKAKQRAVESLYDFNVNFEWWDYIYDDAKTIGIKITGFDLDRQKHCNGEFYYNAEEVAAEIIKNHGEMCETHKTAQSFLDACDNLKSQAENEWKQFCEDFPESDEYGAYEDFFLDNYENGLNELREEFEKDILSDYADMLQNEREYLTSEEAIIESIEANKYEFTEDGQIF